ncbi:hypothetical protein M404DRAFT_1001893 [Pisolithus tinctorius Marx 270]|uniref:Wax synthase domain-containing protein n=1 Tax=Pisolithus tinctorius Marx 270 TaxID=870435 RepID=A0A0C3NP67_PISTI|nr:hypothetical protein M404DRAFT_1001893 [Pisolithus tinctorius Marx 270]
MEGVITSYDFVHSLYRTVIPHPGDRIPFEPRHALHLVAALLPMMYMAYLARRPDTFLLRIMLLPLAVLSILGTFFRFAVLEVGYGTTNWGLASLALTTIAKAIDYAWRPEGMLKIGEEKPGVSIKSPNRRNGSGSPGDPDALTATSSVWQRRLPAWMYDSLELLLTNRGIGWKFGAGVYIPKEHRSLERSAFLSETLASFLHSFLVFDACESFIKLVPGLNTPEGGTMFRPELPIPQRYILSTAVHIATGSAIVAGFDLYYHLSTLVGVGLLSNEPSSWPPVMDHPWQSDSLHIFWAKRWHQILRETFFVYGGFFGGLVAGNIGTVFGTFIGSGLFHEAGAYGLGRGFDPHVVFFFALQAPLLILERIWTRSSGHRVKGIYGRLWVYFCIVVLGQPLVDSWHRRGLGGGYVIDPRISPSRLLLIPFLRWFTELLGLHSVSVLLG